MTIEEKLDGQTRHRGVGVELPTARRFYPGGPKVLGDGVTGWQTLILA